MHDVEVNSYTAVSPEAFSPYTVHSLQFWELCSKRIKTVKRIKRVQLDCFLVGAVKVGGVAVLSIFRE